MPCNAAIDLLRSCYRTQMRFGTGPDAPVKWVRWFFIDDGKPLTVPTVYNSRNWVDRCGQDQGGPGEVIGAKREWVNGQRPPANRCQGVKGSAEAWAGQNNPGDPQYLNPAWRVFGDQTRAAGASISHEAFVRVFREDSRGSARAEGTEEAHLHRPDWSRVSGSSEDLGSFSISFPDTSRGACRSEDHPDVGIDESRGAGHSSDAPEIEADTSRAAGAAED